VDAGEDVLDVEVAEGSSVKLSATEDDVVEDIVVEGSSKKLPLSVEEVAEDIVEDVMEDVAVVEGSSKKLPIPVDEVIAEEEVLDVVESLGSSKKLPLAAAEVVEDVEITEGEAEADVMEVVEEKKPRGPLAPPKPMSGKMPMEPPTPAKPKVNPKATALGPKKAAQTRIGNKAATPTMLAGTQEPDEILDTGLGAPKKPADAEEEIFDVTEAAPGTGLHGPPDEVDMLDEDILVEGASEIDIGKKGGPGAFASGVDMIAEALESGVDLDSSKTRPSKRPPSADVTLDEVDHGADSSAVDLGSDSSLTSTDDSNAVIDVSDEVLEEDAVEVTEGKVDSGKLWGEEEAVETVEDENVLLSGGVEEVVDDLLLAPSSKKKVEIVEEVTEESDIMEGDEELVVPKAKTKTKPTPAFEEVDEVPSVTEEDDEELVVPKSKTKAKVGKSKVAVEEEVEEDLLVAPKAKTKVKTSKVAITVGGDEEEEVGGLQVPPRKRGGGQVTPQPQYPPPKRRTFFAAVFGFLVALLGFLAFFVVAAAVAIWYFRPDLLQEVPASPTDLSENKMRWQAKPKPNLAQEAQDLRQKGKLSEALDKLDKLANTRELTAEELSARADILLDLYLKEKTASKEPLNKDDPQIKKALEDANKSNNLFAVKRIEYFRDLFEKMNAALEKEKAAIALGKVNNAKIDEINKQLEAAKLKEKDVDAVALLLKEKAELEKGGIGLAAQVKMLEKDKMDLMNMVKSLEKDKAGLATTVNDLNKEKDGLALALEKAKLAAQSPVVSYMGNVAQQLTGLGGGLTGVFKQRLDTNRLQAELALMNTKLALYETPEQRLDFWIAMLLNRDRKEKADLNIVSRYVDWVASKEANAKPETKAKALLALGLAQRNHDKFQEAKKTLTEAEIAATRANAKDVGLLAQETLNDLTNPEKHYLPLARRVFEGRRAELGLDTLDGFDRFIMLSPDPSYNRFEEALKVLEVGLAAMPDNAQLLIARAMLRLESTPTGKLPDEIRQDAEKVAKKNDKTAPDALYVLGRLEERLGRLDKAEEFYRQALMHPTLKGEPEERKDRYRLALTKVLQLPRSSPTGAEEKAAPKVDKTSSNTPTPNADQPQLVAAPLLKLLVLSLVCVQDPGDDLEDLLREKRFLESKKLAEELMNSKNPKTQGEGYMMMGKAFLEERKRSEAILFYAKGLELYNPGTKTSDLVKMLLEHPSFQQLDPRIQIDPLLAQRFFAKGVEYFGAREYAKAEKEFQLAVSYFDRDARYHYFLGMARYQQNTKAKREAAAFDFATGTRLEAANRPDSVRINASLERIQGPLRQVLSEYRQKNFAGN